MKKQTKPARTKKALPGRGMVSRKTGNSSYKPTRGRQAHVRKSNIRGGVSLDKKRLFSSLGHLVDMAKTGGKVAAYEQIAAQLSALAGMSNGHSWTWRYVASVHAGTMEPGKKFLRVLALLSSESDLDKKQWLYFTRRRSVAAVYDRVMFRERITAQMRTLGFRQASYTRYNQIKSAATRKRTV